MDALDVDVLSIVFLFLATPVELATLSLVSQRFHTLANANHLWEQILQPFEEEVEAFESNRTHIGSNSIDRNASAKQRYQLFVQHSYYQWERKGDSMVEDNVTRHVKLLLVGDHAAGKTAFISQYQMKIYDYRPVFSVDFQISLLQHRHTKEVIKIQMWDPSGPERYRSISRIYYRGTHGILLIVDLSKDNALKVAQEMYFDVQKSCDNPVVSVLMVGSKADLERKISYEQAKSFADLYGLKYIETSAKTGQNVELAVKMLINEVVKPISETQPEPLVTQPTESRCALQ